MLDFTMVLSSRAMIHYGALSNVDKESIDLITNLNSADELSFDVYKELDGFKEPLWDKITNLRLIYVPEAYDGDGAYFEIAVSDKDGSNSTVKTVTGTSLCEAELSQVYLNNFEVNTEEEIETVTKLNEEWEPTIFYYEDEGKEKYSLLHRILDKVPNYSIGHVDDTLKTNDRGDMQRTFSVDNQTIYDFLTNDVAEQFDVLFRFDSVNRTVSAYDLLTYCNNCGYRGEFTGSCPECSLEEDETDNLSYYGEDTTVYIDKENLTDEVTLEGDKDSVKNCFRLVAGDDTMTAAVTAQNPSGSSYIYYFDEEFLDDMPEELRAGLEAYNYDYEQAYTSCEVKLDLNVVKAYNNLVSKYGQDENGNDGPVQSLLVEKYGATTTYTLESLSNPIYGYPNLMEAMYNAIDFEYYLEHTLMPNRTNPFEKASIEVALLEAAYDGTTTEQTELDESTTTDENAIENGEFKNISLSKITASTSRSTVESSLVNYAKVFVHSGYVDIEAHTEQWSVHMATNGTNNYYYGTWVGYFTLTSYSDSEDTADTKQMTIGVNSNLDTYLQQVIAKNIAKKDDEDDGSVWDVLKVDDLDTFKEYLSVYCLTRLESFKDAISTALDVLMENEVGASTYNKLLDYQAQLASIEAENLEMYDYMAALDEGSYDSLDFTETYFKGLIKTDIDTATASDSINILDHYDEIISCIYEQNRPNQTHDYSDKLDKLINGEMGATDKDIGQKNYCIVYNDSIPDPDYSLGKYIELLEYVMAYVKLVDNFGEEYIAKRNSYIKQYFSYLLYNQQDILYDTCRSHIENILGNSSTDEQENNSTLVELYNGYKNKLTACSEEIDEREAEINIIKAVYNPSDSNGVLIKAKNDINEKLDLQTYLGEDLYSVFCSYRREDTYSNENFISDNLTDAEIIDNAQQFWEKAQKEIKKAGTTQYSLSANLYDLFNIEDFKPLREKVKLGNWIRIKADGTVYRLRLTKIHFKNDTNIEVEFSDVTKAGNVISDVQAILMSAKSMSSSYKYVAKQANSGATANESINNWSTDGLSTSDVTIVSGINQTQVWDDHGLLLRQYNEDTGGYYDEQAKLMSSGYYITTDNWDSLKTAIGKFNYKSPTTGETIEAYGVNGEVLVGKLLLGETLGIYNSSGSLSFTEEGLKVSGTGTDPVTFTVDPSTYSVMRISKGKTDLFSFNDDGNLQITGDIVANKLKVSNDNLEIVTNNSSSGETTTNTGLATVAYSGKYSDLIGTPTTTLATVAYSGKYSDLIGAPKNLQGKTIVLFGDSIWDSQSGYGSNTTNKTIDEYIKSITGSDNVYNCSFWGAGMLKGGTGKDYFSMTALADSIVNKDWTYQNNSISSLSHFSSHLEKLKTINFSDVDIILIEYGTNDYTASVDVETGFKPAIRNIVETLWGAYPHLQIFFCTPTYRRNTDGTDGATTKVGNYYLTDFVQAEKDVAKEYGIKIVDNYYELGFNGYTYSNWYFSNEVSTGKALHINDKGLSLMAEHIIKEIY